MLSNTPLVSGLVGVSNPVRKTFCKKRIRETDTGLLLGSGNMPERANDITCPECRDLIDRLLEVVVEQ